MGIVRPRRSLRMILHTEQRQVAVTQAFERLIIQINVRELDFGLRQRVGIDGEIVVMRGDLDFAGVELLDRMIAAVVSEFEFESFAAERDAGQLMPEADAKDRLASHEAADVVHGVSARLGIAGAVREKHAVGFERENVFGWGLRWDNRHTATFAA